MRLKSIILLFALSTVCTLQAVERVIVIVKNPVKTARVEMVEVECSAIQKKLGVLPDGENHPALVVTDADGNEIPSQVTWDGKLIFQAGVAGKGKSLYYTNRRCPATYIPRAEL